MSMFGSSRQLTIVYHNEAVLTTVLDLAIQFGLRATNDETSEQATPNMQKFPKTLHIVKDEGDGISEGIIDHLKVRIEELHGFDKAILQGHHSGAVMEIKP